MPQGSYRSIEAELTAAETPHRQSMDARPHATLHRLSSTFRRMMHDVHMVTNANTAKDKSQWKLMSKIYTQSPLWHAHMLVHGNKLAASGHTHLHRDKNSWLGIKLVLEIRTTALHGWWGGTCVHTNTHTRTQTLELGELSDMPANPIGQAHLSPKHKHNNTRG